jgi:S-ribosylhomocysteine lyase LuxS involved in autoinducer biosynthesis
VTQKLTKWKPEENKVKIKKKKKKRKGKKKKEYDIRTGEPNQSKFLKPHELMLL